MIVMNWRVQFTGPFFRSYLKTIKPSPFQLSSPVVSLTASFRNSAEQD